MLESYYQDESVTIYHGDCREWMPEADVLLTDPPYGIGATTLNRSMGRSQRARANDWPSVIGDDGPFDPSRLLALGLPTVLWGANHYGPLPPASRWLVWYKRDNKVTNDSADCELAWSNLGGPARVFQHWWMGMIRASERGESYHPTQKPVALMEWVLGMMPVGLVLDPYMGSGSVLLAAKASGRKAVGVEIDKRYCEVAAKRLSNA